MSPLTRQRIHFQECAYHLALDISYILKPNGLFSGRVFLSAPLEECGYTRRPMNLSKVALRALIVGTVGTGLFYVIEPAFQLSPLTSGIIGAIWGLVFIPWIWAPVFREK